MFPKIAQYPWVCLHFEMCSKWNIYKFQLNNWNCILMNYLHVYWTEDIVGKCERAKLKIERNLFLIAKSRRIYCEVIVGVVGLEKDGILDCGRQICQKCCLTTLAKISRPTSCTKETRERFIFVHGRVTTQMYVQFDDI